MAALLGRKSFLPCFLGQKDCRRAANNFCNMLFDESPKLGSKKLHIAVNSNLPQCLKEMTSFEKISSLSYKIAIIFELKNKN